MNRIAERRRILIGAIKTGVLPTGYTQMRYIETDGEPYLSFDFSDLISVNSISNMCITMTAEITGSGVSGYKDRGIFYTTANAKWSGSNIYTNAAGKWAAPEGSSNVVTASGDNFQFNFVYDSQTGFLVYVAGTRSDSTEFNINIDARGFSKSVVFHFGRGGGYTVSLPMRIYGISVNFNDEIMGNMIPCRRDSDGEYGMYDLIHNAFVESSGTIGFTGGNS